MLPTREYSARCDWPGHCITLASSRNVSVNIQRAAEAAAPSSSVVVEVVSRGASYWWDGGQ